jgi:hypothetical protein
MHNSNYSQEKGQDFKSLVKNSIESGKNLTLYQIASLFLCVMNSEFRYSRFDDPIKDLADQIYKDIPEGKEYEYAQAEAMLAQGYLELDKQILKENDKYELIESYKPTRLAGMVVFDEIKNGQGVEIEALQTLQNRLNSLKVRDIDL